MQTGQAQSQPHITGPASGGALSSQQLMQQQQQQQQQQSGTPQSSTAGMMHPSGTGPVTTSGTAPSKLEYPPRLYQLVMDLTDQKKREAALLELSKKREEYPDLAPMLWHSFGTVSALLQEIVSIYPLLSPPRLTPVISNRCCNALALLQCVASHAETRSLFLNAHIPLFLYPFLNTVCSFRQYEYLRLTSLGVIGALVKMDDTEVISFLLQTEIIPLCLRIMDNGSELSKTVATFIIQKILLDDMGLNYICATYDRFSTVSTVLRKMVAGVVERPSVRLLKHIVRCYLRLADNARARDALRSVLPPHLRDNTFTDVLKDDPVTKRWLNQLLFSIGPPAAATAPVGAGAGTAGAVGAASAAGSASGASNGAAGTAGSIAGQVGTSAQTQQTVAGAANPDQLKAALAAAQMGHGLNLPGGVRRMQ